MEFVFHDVNCKRGPDWTHLYFIGDTHHGGAAHNRPALLETVAEIAENPNAIWVGMGDYGDHIYYSDPRFTLNDVDETVTVGELRQGILGQIRKIAADFEPIKDKCVGLLTGNHEEKIVKKYHVDPTREMAYRFNVRYLGYSSLITLRRTIPYKTRNTTALIRVYVHHGYGGGRRHGPQINKVEDAMRFVDADIYAIGHVHGKVSSELMVVGSDNIGRMVKRPKIFVVTASYADTIKEGVTTFAERGMYPEAPLRSPIVKFRIIGKHHRLDMRLGT